jgi:hypothetical protein
MNKLFTQLHMWGVAGKRRRADEGCNNVGRWRLEEEDNGGEFGDTCFHVEKTTF